MSQHCVVTRTFGGPEGRVFEQGEIVDAAEWKHTSRLLAQRYLRLATAEEITSAEDVDPVAAVRPKRRSRHA